MSIYPPNQTTPAKGSGNYVWNWLGSSLKRFAAALQPYLGGGGGGDGYTYTEVDISVSDFMNADSTEIILLPSLPLGSYYEWRMFFEYTSGNVAYDADFMLYSNGCTYDYKALSGGLLPYSPGLVTVFTFDESTLSAVEAATTSAGGAVGEIPLNRIAVSSTPNYVGLYAPIAPTVGDGTAKAKIWYKIRTIG